MYGLITPSQLDKLLEDRAYLGAMYEIRNNKKWMEDIAQSPIAMDIVAASQTAMAAVIASQTAMAAVIASQTAMAAVAASQTAMAAVIASQTAMAAVWGATTALTEIEKSATAVAEFGKVAKEISTSQTIPGRIISVSYWGIHSGYTTTVTGLAGGSISQSAMSTALLTPVTCIRALNNAVVANSGNTSGPRLRYIKVD